MTGHTAITLYGVAAVTFMMAMYALERRHPAFVLAFAAGCLASSAYGFLAGAWPFGMVEAVWSLIAVRRYAVARPPGLPGGGPMKSRGRPAQRPAAERKAADESGG